MPMIAVLGPKGGVGKSTLASNLLVAARLAGLEAAGLDLDPQGSLFAWAATRAAAGVRPHVPVVESTLFRWRESAMLTGGADLLVVDTPPGLPDEGHAGATAALAVQAALVLVPALPELPTLQMLGDVTRALVERGALAVFVLNRVIAGRTATRAARAYLAEYSEVLGPEIPMREDVWRAMGQGLAVLDDARLGGGEAVLALWDVVVDRLGLEVTP
jgi:chromosome partitioning protein